LRLAVLHSIQLRREQASVKQLMKFRYRSKTFVKSLLLLTI
jgi:hypothetical protein